MKILVTGAGGYIGKKLIEHLSGHPEINVVGVTRNIAPIGLKPNILHIQADLSTPGYLTTLPSDIDSILYLAQSSEYRNFPDGAADMFGINVSAVAHLLDWSVKKGIKKFIYASTGNVYKPANKLFTEDDPVVASSYYSATKLNAENLVSQYQSIFNTIMLRIFSIYGPGQQGMMIPAMISRIKSGEMITLAQNKGIMLTPLYISDALQMLTKIVQTEIKSGIYNFCGNETISLGEIIGQIGNTLAIAPHIKITDDPINYLMADGKKLYDAIKYDPLSKMEQGIKLVLSA